jgi:hypothetical protein
MDDFADMNDEQVAELLLALRNPPAQILAHVPEHGGHVDESTRNRSLLLSAIGPIAAMMGAGFIFIQQLFEESGYNMDTLFTRPTWGEYLIHLSPKQQQVFCANTAYYIDAMRHNKQLEVITDEEGIQRLKPLSPSDSTAVAAMTPSTTMRLNGNEIIEKNAADKMVYKQGDVETVLPEDPVEISAFCMAHFLNTENVEILMNWGEDFKLVSEADLLRILGDMREENDWKQRVVGKLFESAYNVYNQTDPYLKYITNTQASIRDAIRSAPTDLEMTYQHHTEYVLPRLKEQVLNKIARNYPKLWATTNTINDYPIQSALVALVALYYLRKPIRAAATVLDQALRLPFRILSWLTGRNPDRHAPDDAFAIEDVRRGGLRGGGKQPSTVIVINNSLPLFYIDKLSELFDDKSHSIDSFVAHININKVPLPKRKLAKKATKSLKKTLIKGLKKGLKRLTGRKDPDSVAAMELQGGKHKKSTKRKEQNKRKTHKR